MSRSSRVAQQHIPLVKVALKRHGFPSQNAFAREMGISRSTINNFFTGKPVDHRYFAEICEQLTLSWQEIARREEELSLKSGTSLQESNFEDSQHFRLCRIAEEREPGLDDRHLAQLVAIAQQQAANIAHLTDVSQEQAYSIRSQAESMCSLASAFTEQAKAFCEFSRSLPDVVTAAWQAVQASEAASCMAQRTLEAIRDLIKTTEMETQFRHSYRLRLRQ